jgi:glutathione S-transferase
MSSGFTPAETAATGIKAALEKYMPLFERILAAQSTPHLHGNAFSMADVCLLEVLLLVEEHTPAAFDNYPKVKVLAQQLLRSNFSCHTCRRSSMPPRRFRA